MAVAFPSISICERLTKWDLLLEKGKRLVSIKEDEYEIHSCVCCWMNPERYTEKIPAVND